eukprot:365412-Chlamydomonas_euryale.AAC.4
MPVCCCCCCRCCCQGRGGGSGGGGGSPVRRRRRRLCRPRLRRRLYRHRPPRRPAGHRVGVLHSLDMAAAPPQRAHAAPMGRETTAADMLDSRLLPPDGRGCR